MSTPPLPSVAHTRDLLSQLFGFGVALKEELGPHTLITPSLCGEYFDEAGELRARLFFDLPLANAAGAALCMIPAMQANEATRKGEITENILANDYEIMNICANLFTETIKDRLIFKSVKTCSAGDLKELLPTPELGRRIEVAIPKYQTGKMVIALT